MTAKRKRIRKPSNPTATNGSALERCGSTKSPSALPTSPSALPTATLPTSKILIHQFLQTMRMRNCSERTIRSWQYILVRFIEWCDQRGIECVSQVTDEHVSAYRRSLFHYRNPRTGQPLKFATQAHYLMPVRRWFRWLLENTWIAADVTAKLELPKEEQRLPTRVLSADQVESLLNQPDLAKLTGVRDRAILETLYSTAIRCAELIDLDVYDLDFDRQIINVRQGKGKKDRVVPIGQRALSWVNKYLVDVRPNFVVDSGVANLFVTSKGRAVHPNQLSAQVKKYLLKVGITHRGACHLLRHSAATLMMEAGADLRSLQLFLGHARINTTQIYTHVSIQRLQEVHRRTHPAKPNELDGKRLSHDDSSIDDTLHDDTSHDD